MQEKFKELFKSPYFLLGLSVFGIGIFLIFREKRTPEKSEKRAIIINNITQKEKKPKKETIEVDETEEIKEESDNAGK